MLHTTLLALNLLTSKVVKQERSSSLDLSLNCSESADIRVDLNSRLTHCNDAFHCNRFGFLKVPEHDVVKPVIYNVKLVPAVSPILTLVKVFPCRVSRTELHDSFGPTTFSFSMFMKDAEQQLSSSRLS